MKSRMKQVHHNLILLGI